MRHSPTPSTAPRCTPKPTMRRVNWSITTSTQCARRMADSHRNRSTLHKLSFACPRTVSHDGPAASGFGRYRTARMRRTTSLLMGIPNARAICCAIRGFPPDQRSTKAQERGGFLDDGGTDQPARADEQHAHAGDEADSEAG